MQTTRTTDPLAPSINPVPPLGLRHPWERFPDSPETPMIERLEVNRRAAAVPPLSHEIRLRWPGFRSGSSRRDGTAALEAFDLALRAQDRGSKVVALATEGVDPLDYIKQNARHAATLARLAIGATVLLLALALPAGAEEATATAKHCYPKGAPEVSTCIGEKGAEACGAYVNLNTATAEELALLYRVGPVLAERIIAGRPYANPVDVDVVKGIGPATYEAMAPYIVTGEGLVTTLAVDIVCEDAPAVPNEG